MAAGDGRDALSNEDAIAYGRRVGVGCFSLFVGLWSGGMIGVLVGKFIEGARRAPTCEGLPVCNWYVYAGIGAAIGAVTLPVLVLWRLRRGRQRDPNARG
jgi:hypothetical protein